MSTRPTSTAVVAPADPPSEFLLVACLDFIQSTQFDGRSWQEHFAPNDPDAPTPQPNDFIRLAEAIEALIETAPDVEPASGFLRGAVTEARSEEPDPAAVVLQLELAQDVFRHEFMLPCLSENDPP